MAHQLATAVVSRVHVLRGTGQVTFRAQLNPPHLGEVQIQMSARPEGVSVHIAVVRPGTEQTISAQLPALRQALQQAGVNVQNLGLTLMTSNGDQHRGPPQEPSRRFGRTGVVRMNIPIPAESTGPPTLPDQGMLNLVV